MTVDKGKGKRIVVRDLVYLGGMCPRCEGMGSVTDIDLSQLYDDSKSLNEGALTIPGYTADGWQVRIFAAASVLDYRFGGRNIAEVLDVGRRHRIASGRPRAAARAAGPAGRFRQIGPTSKRCTADHEAR
jgi:hypothetical protein